MSEPNIEWPLKAWVVSEEGFASEVLARSPRSEHPGCLIYQCPTSGLGSEPVPLDDRIFLDRVVAVGVALERIQKLQFKAANALASVREIQGRKK